MNKTKIKRILFYTLSLAIFGLLLFYDLFFTVPEIYENNIDLAINIFLALFVVGFVVDSYLENKKEKEYFNSLSLDERREHIVSMEKEIKQGSKYSWVFYLAIIVLFFALTQFFFEINLLTLIKNNPAISILSVAVIILSIFSIYIYTQLRNLREGIGYDYDEEDYDDDYENYNGETLDDDDDEDYRDENLEAKMPLDLLDNSYAKPNPGDIRGNKRIIKYVLDKNNMPVRICKTSVGPAVTQYTFTPEPQVDIDALAKLENRFSLFLAAHPVRLEVPIPGTDLIGLEVPNVAKVNIGLRDMLNSKVFNNRHNNLTVPLGVDQRGNVWIDRLDHMPHLLIGGATNSGKSVFLHSMIISLMHQNSPDELKFIMVDPKRVELPVYNNIPHLLTPVITDVRNALNSLKWCLNEMDRRFETLSQSGKRNIREYNKTAEKKMPYIVYIVDELADLMIVAPREIEGYVIRLLQMSRAVGIHIVLATQRPSVDIITGLMVANMPTRLAFSTASESDSRVILDTPGAEKLFGRGDALYVNYEMTKPKRLQVPLITDEDIKNVVLHARENSGEAEYNEDVIMRQKVEGITGATFDEMDDDELLEEAKELIVSSGKASAAYLQRRLSIGYARAARILDLLEEDGVIGPSQGAQPREVLITEEDL